MGMVYAQIELINGDDLALVRRNLLDQDEVKKTIVNALVDTGAYMLCINENIKEQLQLPIIDKRIGFLANGDLIECDVVGNIEVRFENRKSICNAMVLPGINDVLLGAIPLEEMDVLIHPQKQELIVNPDHPYFATLNLKGFRF